MLRKSNFKNETCIAGALVALLGLALVSRHNKTMAGGVAFVVVGVAVLAYGAVMDMLKGIGVLQ